MAQSARVNAAGAGPGSYRARQALARAEDLYMAAMGEDDVGDHFRMLYLAALRGAAAVIEWHGAGGAQRRRTRNAWLLLASVPGEWARWGEYFAAFSGRRAAVEAGAAHRVTPEDADELFRGVGRFLDCVQELVAHGGAAAGAQGVA